MNLFWKTFFTLLALNCLVQTYLYSSSKDKVNNIQTLFTTQPEETQEEIAFELIQEARRKKYQVVENWISEDGEPENPFEALSAYSKIGIEFFNKGELGKPIYNKPNYQLLHDADYCYRVDRYNLVNPTNMFETMNFFTDLAEVKTRTEVIDKIGNVTMEGFSFFSEVRDAPERKYHLDDRINNFFVNYSNFHFHHEIGKDFLCATQMYNQIPGQELMTRKDLSIDNLKLYEESFEDRFHCLPQKLFPRSYRLYIKEECDVFFNIINSDKYQQSRKEQPLQYLLKIAYGPEKSKGITLLYEEAMGELEEKYDHGQKCGSLDHPYITQEFVSRPFLVTGRKFDFTTYMLVVSTNPLIVYYHDGLLRVSLKPYDTDSTEKAVHLTCTHLSKAIFAQAAFEGDLHKENHLWTFDKLEKYLLESEVIREPGWLGQYIRPKIQQAFIHLLRMAKQGFLNQSNVYQLFQLDFLLDDNLDLLHVKTHSNPPLDFLTEKSSDFLVQMLKNMFEVQYAYYRSRMLRVTEVIKRLQNEILKNEPIDYEEWRNEYELANRNRLEPEYEISKENSWTLIMDENLEGAKAYFGQVFEDCV